MDRPGKKSEGGPPIPGLAKKGDTLNRPRSSIFPPTGWDGPINQAACLGTERRGPLLVVIDYQKK